MIKYFSPVMVFAFLAAAGLNPVAAQTLGNGDAGFELEIEDGQTFLVEHGGNPNAPDTGIPAVDDDRLKYLDPDRLKENLQNNGAPNLGSDEILGSDEFVSLLSDNQLIELNKRLRHVRKAGLTLELDDPENWAQMQNILSGDYSPDQIHKLTQAMEIEAKMKTLYEQTGNEKYLRKAERKKAKLLAKVDQLSGLPIEEDLFEDDDDLFDNHRQRRGGDLNRIEKGTRQASRDIENVWEREWEMDKKIDERKWEMGKKLNERHWKMDKDALKGDREMAKAAYEQSREMAKEVREQSRELAKEAREQSRELTKVAQEISKEAAKAAKEAAKEAEKAAKEALKF